MGENLKMFILEYSELHIPSVKYMKTILIICYSPLHRDPRVLRQINWLKDTYTIYAAGYTDPKISGINYIPFNKCYSSFLSKVIRAIKLLCRFYNWAYWNSIRNRQFNLIANIKYDLVIANDVDALPVTYKISKLNNVPFIFDAHEYYPDFAQKRTIITWLQKNEIIYQCNRYLKYATTVTTVANGISKLYEANFSIYPKIIRNSSALKKTVISKVDPRDIKLVHHGGTLPGRQLEKMIDLIVHLGQNYSLHFYLLTPKELHWYEKKIVEYANSVEANIEFHKPVNTNAITEEINKYDIGLFLLPPTNTNYKFALPNKFFEFIQARLAIAIGPSPEMASMVKKYKLGVVSTLFTAESLADEIKKMTTEDILYYKNNCDRSAEELSEETEKKRFSFIVKEALMDHFM